MKVRVSEDVEAPLTMVWRGFVDFSRIEHDIRSRGADLVRLGDWNSAQRGAAWHGSVPVRGKTRSIEAQITAFETEERIVVDSRVGGMTGHYAMEFVGLSANVTRVVVTLEMKASTLSARLLLQTLRLARKRVIQRLENALSRQGKDVEAAYRSAG